MSSPVKIIECPRDAWQGLPKQIPSEVKADYLRLLLEAGFRHLDAASFVSPTAVPQMADSERVLALLDPPADVEIIGIVVNSKGAERAIATESVTTLGFPYSVSPEFLQRNQRQTPEESLDALESIGQLGFKAGLGMVAYVSMAFGNPYGDPWNEDEVVAACDLLADSGIEQISLADTIGLATPDQIESVVGAALESVGGAAGGIEIGVHFHARLHDGAAKITAAYRAGCRRFDMAIGGLGGCPFASDMLVGNVATELALDALSAACATLPDFGSLDTVLEASLAIANNYGATEQ